MLDGRARVSPICSNPTVFVSPPPLDLTSLPPYTLFGLCAFASPAENPRWPSFSKPSGILPPLVYVPYIVASQSFFLFFLPLANSVIASERNLFPNPAFSRGHQHRRRDVSLLFHRPSAFPPLLFHPNYGNYALPFPREGSTTSGTSDLVPSKTFVRNPPPCGPQRGIDPSTHEGARNPFGDVVAQLKDLFPLFSPADSLPCLFI